MFNCQHCDAELITYLRYTKHLKLFHESSPGFRVTCNLDNCRDSFTTVRYLVRHVNTKHRSTLRNDSVNIENVDDDVSDEGEREHSLTSDSLQSQPALEQDVDRVDRLTVQQHVCQFEKQIAQCILKLQEKHILPVVVQQDIIAEMQLVASQIHDTYSSIFRSFCEEQGLSIDIIDSDIGEFLCRENSIFNNVFENFSSDYTLKKYITTNFRWQVTMSTVKMSTVTMSKSKCRKLKMSTVTMSKVNMPKCHTPAVHNSG